MHVDFSKYMMTYGQACLAEQYKHSNLATRTYIADPVKQYMF